MSFGNLTKMFEKTKEILSTTTNTKSKITLLNLEKNKNNVYMELLKSFPDVSYQVVDQIFARLFEQKYIYNPNIEFTGGSNCFREFEDKYPDIKIPSQYKKLNEHFEKLKNLPQPAQRSKEWYDYRYNRITASDMAAAIDLNPYEPVESFILKKCDPNFPFHDNATVFHGKKYEPTATMIYEHIYNSRVFEFGALPSDKYSFLGASPDGICSKYTLDNKFSDRLGRMLEIKCPVTREIITNGKIEGEICPFYYYCQVQQQLVCCELDSCDFWQCKITEYKSKSDYMRDDCTSCKNTHSVTGEEIQIDNRLKKGIILEFYPKVFKPEFPGDIPEWKSKYIIPKRLDMNESQYNEWVLDMLDNYKEQYLEISENYYFYRIIYWKLESTHNVEIKRDDVFFSNVLPVLKDTWEKIKYWRKNQDKLDELKLVAEKRKKYIKTFSTYKIHNIDITKGKHKLLSEDFDHTSLLSDPPSKKNSNYSNWKNYTKKSSKSESHDKNKDYDSDYYDFADDCDFIDDEPNEKSFGKVPKKKPEKNSGKKIAHTDFAKPNTQSSGKLVINSFKNLFPDNETTNSHIDDCDFID